MTPFHRVLSALVFFLLVGAQSFADISSYAIIGDAGLWSPPTESVRDSIRRTGVRQLILPGDNLYQSESGNTYDRTWIPWREFGFVFKAVAIGNHSGGYPAEMKYFGLPGEFYSVQPTPHIRFIVLNSDDTANVPAQAEFLEKQLRNATEPFVFLVYHHPSYTVSKNHTWQEKGQFQNAIRGLIGQYRNKISGLIVGHDHMASLISVNDLPLIVSGAVRDTGKQKPVDYVDHGVRVKTQWLFDHTPHWTRLDIDSDKNIFQIIFVRAQDSRAVCSVLFTAKAHEGKMSPSCKN